MSAADGELPSEESRAVQRQVRMVLSMAFLISLGQATLNPVLAPLTRELDLHEWQAGLILTTSSAMMVLSARSWGMRSQRIGRKPVLIGAAVGAATGLILFAIGAQLGMSGLLTGALMYSILLLARGFIFGISAAAVSPTAQAFIADVTTNESDRVRGMAQFGAVMGLSMIGGSIIGGLLATVSLMTSIMLVPLLPLAATIFGAKFLKREKATELIAKPKKVRASDGRVWPFLTVSLGVNTVYNMIIIMAGFIIQDRYDTIPERLVPFVISGTLIAGGLGMLTAQGFVVPRSGWRPVTLIRVGTLVVTSSFVIGLFQGAPLWLFVASIFIAGLGFGIVAPGTVTAPTLLFTREEQGGLAGTMNSINSIAWMVSPITATLLYGAWPFGLSLLCFALVASATLFAFLNPTIAGRKYR